MKEYKVLDLSYSSDPEQHLTDVRAFHEREGWRLLSVVYAQGKWLYYLERDAPESFVKIEREAARLARRGISRTLAASGPPGPPPRPSEELRLTTEVKY